MRLHIRLDDALVGELARRAGARGRRAYIERTLRRALEDERLWEEIEASIGGLDAEGHEWDRDPAAWVRAQRRGDPGRVG